MNTIFRKILAFALTAVMFIGIVPFTGKTITASAGVYYDNVYTEGVFTYVLTKNNEAIIYKCNDANITQIDIPSELGGYPVISLGYIPYSPEGGAPDGIEGKVFSDCYNLNRITIPKSIRNIEPGTFKGTDYYNNEENWANGLLYIDDYLVAVKGGYDEYIIKDGTTRMIWGAFEERDDILSITLNEDLKDVPALAFYRCTNISEIIISESVTNIGTSAFSNCRNLSTERLPENLISIETYAFSNCENLVSINIPDSVDIIKSGTFEGCEKLENIFFGKNISKIEYEAFSFCNNLEDIYFVGTEEEWNNIIMEGGNDPLLNATIHFLGEEEHKHELTHRTVESTCKVAGMEYDICLECGESFNVVTLPLAEHSWSDWMTRAEATGSVEGEKYRTCSVCGKEETKSVPKLNVIEDEKTGIEIEFDNEYDSGVEIKVEEVFDGNSFELLEKTYGGIKSKIFDISTIKDGVKVQPDGKVKVRIPLPEGFGKMPIWVNFIDSENGTVEKIPAEVVNGYVEFETEHFSYYAVVEKLGKVNYVSVDDISMNYKSTTTVEPAIKADVGVDYTVAYSSSDTSVVQVDANGKVTSTGTGSAVITCTVTDEYGNTVSDTCDISAKYTWWQWIIVIVLFGWIWY